MRTPHNQLRPADVGSARLKDMKQVREEVSKDAQKKVKTEIKQESSKDIKVEVKEETTRKADGILGASLSVVRQGASG